VVIYDDLVSETLIEPLPAQPAADVQPVEEARPAGHDATACEVCQAWLAHVRDAEHS
jgi:hypothetical protein